VKAVTAPALDPSRPDRSGIDPAPRAAPVPAAARARRWAPAVAAVARRPVLWSTGARQVLRLAPTGWWRRAPFLPLPDGAYLRFRLQTAYGDPHAAPRPADVVTYLHWCRAWPRVAERKHASILSKTRESRPFGR
jgi:hypothetical protein